MCQGEHLYPDPGPTPPFGNPGTTYFTGRITAPVPQPIVRAMGGMRMIQGVSSATRCRRSGDAVAGLDGTLAARDVRNVQ